MPSFDVRITFLVDVDLDDDAPTTDTVVFAATEKIEGGDGDVVSVSWESDVVAP